MIYALIYAVLALVFFCAVVAYVARHPFYEIVLSRLLLATLVWPLTVTAVVITLLFDRD